MSVRLGCVLPKEVAMNNTFSPKNKKAHWKYVGIEGKLQFKIHH